jgi:protein-L-isoaspartate(D-aspartate) O-methyltransferase
MVMSQPGPSRRDLATLAERYAKSRPDRWAPVPAELDRAIAADRALGEAALWARRHLLGDVLRRLADLVPPFAVTRYADALLMVPRERFVLPEEIASSADDAPSPLDPAGRATVSAPHAYLLTYGLLGLGEGDTLIELGTGTGYGAALASRIVGPRGSVTSIEIDPALSERASRLLAEPDLRGPARGELLTGDAKDLGPRVIARATGRVRVAVTYAVSAPPTPLLAALPSGGRLVAPVGEEDQRLKRWERAAGGSATLTETSHGAVRYVSERS